MPSAEALREKLKRREAVILDVLEDNEELFVEYHSPAGVAVRVRDIALYLDTDDLLVLAGWDLRTGQECQIIASPLTVQLVFRVIRVEDGEVPERRPIGFIKGPEFKQP